MIVELGTTILGWLTQSAGRTGIRLLRESPDNRALRNAIDVAVRGTVSRVAPESRPALQSSLNECFSSRQWLRSAASAPTVEDLRAAITAQIMGVRATDLEGRAFYRQLQIDPDWLVISFIAAIEAALRQEAPSSRLAGLIRAKDAADMLSRLAPENTQAHHPPVLALGTMHTLPRGVTSFIGRRPELEHLRMTVSRAMNSSAPPDICAIDGMAGAGKTALAVQAAHELAPSFPDGQFFLCLHSYTPGQQPVDLTDALRTLLLSTGIAAEQIPEELEGRADLWRGRMAGKRVLLVLDDASNSDQVRFLLPGAQESLVIVTSRRRLTALEGAITISLDVLPADEALELFVRMAARADVTKEDRGVVELVELCGRLPLAIRLMAGRLRHHAAWRPMDLVSTLTTTQHRLLSMRAENVSVASAFDLSYQDLDSTEQRFFRRLGLNPGSDIDIYAAAALNGTSVDIARHQLEELYLYHLLEEPVRGRYRFHDLIREYARSLAMTDPAADTHQAVGRLLNYYLHTALTAGSFFATRTPTARVRVDEPPRFFPELSDRRQAADWLETERANLHAGVERAEYLHRPYHAVALAATMADFLFTNGHWDQAHALHRKARSISRQVGDPEREAIALTNLGITQYLKGDYPGAFASLRTALVIFQQAQSRLAEANVLNYLGIVHYLAGDYPRAIADQTRALDLFRTLGDRLGEAHALNYRAIAYYLIADYPAAVAGQGAALEIFRSLGKPPDEAHVLNCLGIVQYLMGDYPSAEQSLQTAHEIFRYFNDRYGEAHVLSRLAIVRLLTGDYPASIDLQTRALNLFCSLGGSYGIATSLGRLGESQYMNAEYSASRASLERALELFRELGNEHGQANIHNHLGVVAHRMGDHSSAGHYLRSAANAFQRLGDRYDEANTLNNLGELSADLRSREDIMFHERALRIAQEIGAPVEEARALEGLGRYLLNENRGDEGVEHLGRALHIYLRIGSPCAHHVTASLGALNPER